MRHLKPKPTSLLILAVTSLVSTRALFFLFDDPEGPNLFVVIITAIVVYCISLTVYFRKTPIVGTKKLIMAIFVQMIVALTLYFLFRYV